MLLDAEQSEAVLDLLGERYAGKEGNRVVILAVEATLPRDAPEPLLWVQPADLRRAPEGEDTQIDRAYVRGGAPGCRTNRTIK